MRAYATASERHVLRRGSESVTTCGKKPCDTSSSVTLSRWSNLIKWQSLAKLRTLKWRRDTVVQLSSCTCSGESGIELLHVGGGSAACARDRATPSTSTRRPSMKTWATIVAECKGVLQKKDENASNKAQSEAAHSESDSGRMSDAATASGEARNEWQEVLHSATLASSRLPPARALLLGDRGAGKSALLARLRAHAGDRAPALDAIGGDVALGYGALPLRNAADRNDVLERAHVWLLDGAPAHAPLLATPAPTAAGKHLLWRERGRVEGGGRRVRQR